MGIEKYHKLKIRTGITGLKTRIWIDDKELFGVVAVGVKEINMHERNEVTIKFIPQEMDVDVDFTQEKGRSDGD